MKEHEKEHCDFFENEIKKRNIKPTKFLPLWDLLGVGLGFGSTLLPDQHFSKFSLWQVSLFIYRLSNC